MTRRWQTALATGVALVLLGLSGAANAAPGIRGTRHDLSNTSATPGPKNTNVGANQICIYCHTPHRANLTRLVWNHDPTAVASYTWGGETTTVEGTTLPTAALQEGSKRCLGCHDGTVALGEVNNMGGGVAGKILGLETISGETDASGNLSNASYLVGASGNMAGNHPINIPYAQQTYFSVVSQATADGAVGNYYAILTNVSCTSPSGTCTTAPNTDGRDGAAINLIQGTGGFGVECGSCHEPHNKYDFPYFTRVNVANASGLCRSCHNK